MLVCDILHFGAADGFDTDAIYIANSARVEAGGIFVLFIDDGTVSRCCVCVCVYWLAGWLV